MTTLACECDDCTWTYEAQDQEDAIDAYEHHVLAGCPQHPADAEPSTSGPDDPAGTVRAGTGVLAVRAHSANPDYGDDLSWFIIDIGAQSDMQPDAIERQLGTWPIVYQP